ncbi:MAG TPA: acetate/propionate family kinase [Rhodanobacteraceae bacterium]|nr:acetate/propionate family kinase [Rhodanobacteraceae bacterium]
MTPAILALNLGSSSVKSALFEATTLAVIERGSITGIGGHPRAEFRDSKGAPIAAPEFPRGLGLEEAVGWLLGHLRERMPEVRLAAVGHRVVHGGTRFDKPIRITADVLTELDALSPLAPNHQPFALAAIRSVSTQLPEVPQIACFDTAFHRSQSRLAQWFALPRALSESGVIRYGFHGISYEYIASVLPDIAGEAANGRVIVAHLGHGASLCAMRNLRSVATSMGFTPLDGLMMGTRCGSLDPGVVLYLLRERGMSPAQVEELLGKRSGLLGVSGLSDDVHTLEANDDPRAREALDMFADRTAAEIAAHCTALGGLDALVFTAGIGEHSARMRAEICKRLNWIGVTLDEAANFRHAQDVSATNSSVKIFVVPTDEEAVIARAARRLVSP